MTTENNLTDKYDTFWSRFFAGLLDGIILFPVSFVADNLKRSESSFVIVMGLFMSYSIFYFYSVGLHWYSGQTIGKKWMNIRVVDQSENKLMTLQQSFLRDSVYIVLETLGLIVLSIQILRLGHYPYDPSPIMTYLAWLGTAWFLLEIFSMLTNNKRRAFHDFIANSVVIKENYWNNRHDR